MCCVYEKDQEEEQELVWDIRARAPFVVLARNTPVGVIFAENHLAATIPSRSDFPFGHRFRLSPLSPDCTSAVTA